MIIMDNDSKAASLFVNFVVQKGLCAISHELCFVFYSVSDIVSALTGAND